MLQVFPHEFHDVFRLGHATFAHQAAGEFPTFGGNFDVAPFQKGRNILYGGGVGDHVQVHGRGEIDRTVGAQIRGKQKIVGLSTGHFGQGMGGGRGDDKEIGPAAQLHVVVPHPFFFGLFDEQARNGLTAEGSQGERGHEFCGEGGHDHPHFGSFLDQVAYQESRFVSGNASRHAQEDAFAPQQ